MRQETLEFVLEKLLLFLIGCETNIKHVVDNGDNVLSENSLLDGLHNERDKLLKAIQEIENELGI